MKPSLNVTIARVDTALFDGAATSVRVPGTEGEMTILPQHEALISELSNGTVYVDVDGEEKAFPIERGMIEIRDNVATILV